MPGVLLSHYLQRLSYNDARTPSDFFNGSHLRFVLILNDRRVISETLALDKTPGRQGDELPDNEAGKF
jgi:hypothetical protein